MPLPAPPASACQGVTGRESSSTTGANVIDRYATGPHRSTDSGKRAVTASPAAASTSGATEDSSAAVGRRPSSDAHTEAMPAASSGVKNVPGTLCATALQNRPVALGIASSAATEPAPVDWPKTVTRPGLPPKAWTLSRTHSRAAT